MEASLTVPSRSRLAAVWLAVAALFGALLVAAQAAESGLDDPDPSRQRPGFLDAGSLPAPAAPVTNALPARGRRAVVFFVREPGLGGLCRAVGHSGLARQADLVAVMVGASRACPTELEVVADTTGSHARRYAMPLPRDGGAPVGYAIVDSRSQIRYRTLDPAVVDELAEVTTILGAVP